MNREIIYIQAQAAPDQNQFKQLLATRSHLLILWISYTKEAEWMGSASAADWTAGL